MAQHTKYPFKFLDAYSRDDQDIFFGRDEEVETLYQMVFQTDLILVYGASGTGKTSLIQCGLASKFQPYEWLALPIRRGADINESLEKALDAASAGDSAGVTSSPADTTGADTANNLDWLDERPTEASAEPLSPVAQRLRNLYLRHFKPIFLLFDQFEELYILGTKDEQNRFVDTVREILRIEQPVKIMLSIREEYLGYLYEFERKVPELLRKKLRIEPMNLEKMQTVVGGISRLPYGNVHLRKGQENAIGAGIFEKLKERENVLTIELPYLQVFLDKLYLQITGDESRQAAAEFTVEELQKMGDIGDVLRNFLDDQVQQNARELGVPPDTVKKLLSPFVTLDGTKEPLSAELLHLRLPDLDAPLIARSLQAFQNSRILRFDEKEQRYEVAHDSLARQIATYQDAEDIALQKSAQMIRTQMLLDTEKREVFSEKQLLFMEPYLSKLDLTAAEQAWVEQSRAHWEQESLRMQQENEEKLAAAERQAEKERELRESAEAAKTEAVTAKTEAEANEKRARQRTRIAALAFALALGLAMIAGWSYLRANHIAELAQEQKTLAEKKTQETADALKKVEQEKTATEEQRSIAQKKTLEAESNFQRAEENLKKAQAEENRAKAALLQVKREQSATDEQRRIAEQNFKNAQLATTKAEKEQKNAEETLIKLKKANEEFVQRFLQNARKDISDGRYKDALEKIKTAEGLGVLKEEVCNAYMENADSSLLHNEFEVALESVKAAATFGILSSEAIGKDYLNVAEKSILLLEFEVALEGAKAAAALGVLKPEVSGIYLEIAFWHGEAGNSLRATGILDSAALLLGKKTDRSQPHRKAIEAFNTIVYKKLMERYYPVMVPVEGGTFDMGCDPGEKCQDLHKQEVSAFQMAKYETTWWQYALFCKATGNEYSSPGWGTEGHNPAVNVSWYDAVAYCNWVSKQLGKKEVIAKNADGKYSVTLRTGYRLPTEAEWEYAAGGGNKSRNRYAGTDNENQLKDFAWYTENSGNGPRAAGTRNANLLDLYDMSGNVWEWCWDWYGDYPKVLKKDYDGPLVGSRRVLRGGSWTDLAEFCRSAYRYGNYPGFRTSPLGFRLVFVP